MEHSTIIAGFGGQGVMLIGQLLGYGATFAGKQVTYYPAYGPEQRGGTANCTIVIADGDVGAPVVEEADTVIIMNEPSLVKFEPAVKPGGTIIVNSSLVKMKVQRKDVRAVYIPTNEIAESLGEPKTANMVMLGAFIGATGCVAMKMIEQAVQQKLAKKAAVYQANKKALHAGSEYAGKGISQ